jgi:hypothetical protein
VNVHAVRKMVLREIATVTDMAEAMLYTAPSLSLPPKRYRDRDGRWRTDASGGEWDWYWRLGNRERMRLVCRRCEPGGVQPDELHFYWGAGLGYDDVESTMWAWLGYTRIADAGYVLLHGNLPRATAYGGADANDLFPDTGHDLNQLFGRDARQYLADWVDPEELAAS